MAYYHRDLTQPFQQYLQVLAKYLLVGIGIQEVVPGGKEASIGTVTKEEAHPKVPKQVLDNLG